MFARLRLFFTCAAFGLLSASNASAGEPPPVTPTGPSLIKPKFEQFQVWYRCPNPKIQTFFNQAQALAFQNKLRSLGFQTQLSRQFFRYQVRFELNPWRQKAFFGIMGQGQALSLQNWLNGIGAQTKLMHH